MVREGGRSQNTNVEKKPPEQRAGKSVLARGTPHSETGTHLSACPSGSREATGREEEHGVRGRLAREEEVT